MTARDRQIIIMLESGMPASAVGREMGLSARHIERIRSIYTSNPGSEETRWKRMCAEGSRALREATERVYGRASA